MLTDLWKLMRSADTALVVTIVSICVSLLIYRWQRQRKELACGAISSSRLISIADSVSSRVKVLLDDNPVVDLHLHIFGFKNSGNKAIDESDFFRPLSLTLSEGAIVSVQIVAQHPKSLNAQLRVEERKVEISPLLLNAGDFLVIQVLASAKTLPAINFRIKDIPEASRLNKLKASDALVTPVLGIFFGGMALVIADGHLQNGNWALFFMGLVFVVIFGIGGLAMLLISSAIRRRRINY